ncbi:MAG TPA: MASE1 domain-containing protein [Gemmatimonadaceae bacterium]|nr:MASE1 domain-containing protein [Gemmatimonadaceae bacterium]
MQRRFADTRAIVVLAAIYIATARFGMSFDRMAGFAALVWPPSGISLAAVLLLGNRVWPGIFIGGAIANILIGAPPLAALGIGIGTSAEALVGAFLLRRARNFSMTLETVPSIVELIVFGALLSTTISATIGVGSLFLSHSVVATQFPGAWRAWWVGDMVGILLFTPIVLVWMRRPAARFPQSLAERIALAVAIVAVNALTFFNDLPHVPAIATPFHQMDLFISVMIWAALRAGQRGLVTATVCSSATALVATVSGFGPFVFGDVHESLLSLQTFMAIVAATSMLVGATIAELHIANERAQAANALAEEANRAKSEFLAVMSHELRTPLNAIAGYSQLLATGVYGSLNEKQTDAVGRITRSERALLGIIDQLLALVKIEKGDAGVHNQPVRVAEAFDKVESIVRPEIDRKHFVMKRDIHRPSLAVRADQQGLQQILVSLLSNASKYTEDGGVITLGADRVDGRVRIWVSDTGVGIPQDAMEKVFEPFFQAERGTTRRFSGVGLGLTIARDLARQMSGELTIASAAGSGTTATVVLPAA